MLMKSVTIRNLLDEVEVKVVYNKKGFYDLTYKNGVRGYVTIVDEKNRRQTFEMKSDKDLGMRG